MESRYYMPICPGQRELTRLQELKMFQLSKTFVHIPGLYESASLTCSKKKKEEEEKGERLEKEPEFLVRFSIQSEAELSSHIESDPQGVSVHERGGQRLLTHSNLFLDDPFSIKSPPSKVFLDSRPLPFNQVTEARFLI